MSPEATSRAETLKPRALLVGGESFLPTVFSPAFQTRLHQMVDCDRPISTAALLARPEQLAGIEFLFTTWGAPQLDHDLLAHAPRLRAVLHVAGSVRVIATDALWTRDIAVTSAHVVNAIPTAEFALAAILLANKRVWHHALAGKLRRQQAPADFTERSRGAGNHRSVIGLVSYGSVAREVRRLLRAFQLEVIVHDPYVDQATADRDAFRLVSLAELFARADVVSVHTPLLPETMNLIRREHLVRLKPYASFINTARGALVDETELIAVLTARPDVQAVLDVTCPEPPAAGSPLYELPNVVLTPHLAGSLGPECERMSEAMAGELERYLAGEAFRWQITRRHLCSMA